MSNLKAEIKQYPFWKGHRSDGITQWSPEGFYFIVSHHYPRPFHHSLPFLSKISSWYPSFIPLFSLPAVLFSFFFPHCTLTLPPRILISQSFMVTPLLSPPLNVSPPLSLSLSLSLSFSLSLRLPPTPASQFLYPSSHFPSSWLVDPFDRFTPPSPPTPPLSPSSLVPLVKLHD